MHRLWLKFSVLALAVGLPLGTNALQRTLTTFSHHPLVALHQDAAPGLTARWLARTLDLSATQRTTWTQLDALHREELRTQQDEVASARFALQFAERDAAAARRHRELADALAQQQATTVAFESRLRATLSPTQLARLDTWQARLRDTESLGQSALATLRLGAR